ncbi:MAG: adenylate kinase [Candidatus Omnitrophica bacterium]|nr:adenylate kinase [Candidatus Omnitrophota bacterium]
MRIVLLGPPGAGKGSLAGLIRGMTGIAHISTGDMLREEMKKASPLGKEIRGFVEKGALVPDDVVTRLVEEKVSHDPGLDKGYMLDGFPRTVKQAQDLDAMLTRAKKPLDFALYMRADPDVILTRLTGRRVCKACGALYHLKNKPPKTQDVCDLCGGQVTRRSDDHEDTIRRRMDVYAISTKPIIDYYARQKKLKEVDGNAKTTDVRNHLISLLNDDKSDQDQKPRRD